VLDKVKFQKFPLVEKLIISHNTAIYRFGLPHQQDILGLPIGQHISVMASVDGKEVLRSYTPTSSDDDTGYFDLLIKTYPNGNLSRVFANLQIGDTIEVRGPKGNFTYTPGLVKSFGMIAGGTGITPMYQVIKAILKNPNDKTQINLIYANVNQEDILLREELDELAKHHENFNIHHVLNNPPEGWTGGVGFVTQDMIKKLCPGPSNDSKILLCGPPPMVKAMSEYCVELGYQKPRAVSKLEDQVFKF
ncbi:ferredoxin reductase-like protein, partial [Basidiobolus meristosporus CBS 931.73]